LIGGTEGFRAAGSFQSMEEALTGIGQDLPDVALLDIGLPVYPASTVSAC